MSGNAVDVAVDIVKAKKFIAFICVLYHKSVALFEWDLTAKPFKPPFLKWLTHLSYQVSSKVMYQQVEFIDHNSLSLLSNGIDGSFVYFVDLEDGSIGEDIVHFKEEVRGLVKPLIMMNSKTTIFLVGNDVVEFSLSTKDEFRRSSTQKRRIFPNLSPRVEAVSLQIEATEPIEGRVYSKGSTTEFLVFGLSDSGLLFANERLLARNCTSFLVTPAHLIFTTGQHLLKFVHIAKADGKLLGSLLLIIRLIHFLDLDVPLDAPEIDERCRNIERGAKLVTVMPSTFALVLQMPRGNLETIYPRALVLASIRHSINGKKYKKAFLTCRSQKVDMNILYDHDPPTFLTNVGLFVNQLEKAEYLDLFLSQLRYIHLHSKISWINNRREVDVSKTMYRETGVNIRQGKTNLVSTFLHNGGSKINTICDAFLKTLHSRTSRLQNVVTAHACKSPPDLDAGLTEIAKIRGTI